MEIPARSARRGEDVSGGPAAGADLHVRRAEPDDLSAAYAVFYANEIRGAASPPPPGPPPAILRHVLESGDLIVAEIEGAVVGFAGAVPRGAVSYLTDLFVRPECQSSAVGRSLLRHVLPDEGRPRWTLASSDPRALALYARAGLQPRWPNVELRLEPGQLRALPRSGVEAVEATPGDPELVAWDAEIGGRPRPQEHAFWTRRQGAQPLWFRRRGEVVGYGYVRPRIDTVWTPEKVVIGPVGSRSTDDAAACVLAAAAWAHRLGSVLEVALPGPHPALAPLLEAGFRIHYVETFCASESASAVDPARYAGSGGDLF